MLNSVYKILEVQPQEIILLDDVKNYLRITDDFDDKLIGELIYTAIDIAEKFLGLSLLTKKVRFYKKQLDDYRFDLKYLPIINIDKIEITTDTKSEILESDNYLLNNGVLYLTNIINNNIENIAIDYFIGFTKENIPQVLKQGILLHVSEMYDRDNLKSNQFSQIVTNLYSSYRKLRL